MGMSTANAKDIRNALKAKGWGILQVSVRNDSYSMGSTVRVRVRDAAVPLAEVIEIAERYQNVRRDESGDILSGGNSFVDVEYDRTALAEHAAVALEQLRAGRDTFGPFHVDPKGSVPGCASIWYMRDGTGSHLRNCMGELASETTAETLVELLARHGKLDLLAPPSLDARVVQLAGMWQRRYPCPQDCPELAALWNAIESGK